MPILQATTYIGENLEYGKWGYIAVLLAFVASGLGAFSYFKATNNDSEDSLGWKKLGDLSFRIHSAGVLGIIAVLFILLLNHHYEYYYVWKHSSDEMPLRYILSCFWEGQEGSFLLWVFWHVVLGNILIYTAKNWKSPVMAVFCLTQLFLTSMLLGIYLPVPEFLGSEWQIGSNPFTSLLREHKDFFESPIFLQADYLNKIDGNGLNPLLQNYWMTIHPPTLFLGFASTLVPFAYAIAGLWTKKYNEWMTPTIPWIFFGVMILGTGILMGGAWAYEALSFGGFWAWDPVENSSLMPWIILVAAAHVMMIQKRRNEATYTTFILTIMSFLLVLYSTYLTRSGILGDTSVHSFAGGLPGQLILFMAIFFFISVYKLIHNAFLGRAFILYSVVGALILYFIPDDLTLLDAIKVDMILKIIFCGGMIYFLWVGYRNFFPKGHDEEEAFSSREFWMFIGVLVLILSAFQVIVSTSLPVFNTLFGTDKVLSGDPIDHYNKWQLPIAIIIAILIGFTQFFKYKKTDIPGFRKNMRLSFYGAVISAVVVAFVSNKIGISSETAEWIPFIVQSGVYFLMFFACFFAIYGNLDYFLRILKGKLKNAGGSISHIGFALILLGAFASTSHKEVISQNTSEVDITSLTDELQNNENILLQKGDTLPMGDYWVTYSGKFQDGIYVSFNIEYLKKTDGQFKNEFTLNPLVQTNKKMGNVAEPGTKHFVFEDIYTHIQWADLDTTTVKEGTYDEGTMYQLKVGDTITTRNQMIVLDGLNKYIDKEKYGLAPLDLAIAANLKIIDRDFNEAKASPVFVLKEKGIESTIERMDEQGLIIQFAKIDPANEVFTFNIKEVQQAKDDFVIMKAIRFPFINVLWLGCFVMIFGTVLAIIHRIKLLSKSKSSHAA